VALEHLIKLHQGVYAGILGPTYATRAELQYYIDSGCDAIGMSVVQEATVAAHSGMQIIGLSAITDMALPYVAHHTTEDEVVAAGKRIAGSLKTLIVEIAKRI
jgi:purine-nucleoside phosphorylase